RRPFGVAVEDGPDLVVNLLKFLGGDPHSRAAKPGRVTPLGGLSVTESLPRAQPVELVLKECLRGGLRRQPVLKLRPGRGQVLARVNRPPGLFLSGSR